MRARGKRAIDETAAPPAGAGPVTVSLIVPARNEERFLPGCLRSISALRLPPAVAAVEVIVVDNESTDQTVAVAERAGARVLVLPPRTIARSRNAGARAAAGEWLAFVDADCELPPDWLEHAAEHLSDAGTVAFGATLAPPPPACGERADRAASGDETSAPDGDRGGGSARGSTWVERGCHLLAAPRGCGGYATVGWLASSNFLVRRAPFEKAGGFAEELVSCEDADLGYRLSPRGALVLDDRCRVVHHRESRTLRELFRREAWRSRGNFPGLRRHGLLLAELPSLALPLLFVAGPPLCGALLLAPVLPLSLALLPLAASLALLPLQLVRRGIPWRAPRQAPGCLLLAAAYLAARGLGTLLPFRRV